MKALVVQSAYLGDVVLATSLLNSLWQSKKFEKVAILARPFATELLRGLPYEVIPFNKTLRETFRLISTLKRFDAIISPHRSMRTSLMLFFSGVKKRAGFARAELPFLYPIRVEHLWQEHEIERNLRLAKSLFPWLKLAPTTLFVSQEEKSIVRKKFNLPEKYVVFAPQSQFELKEWKRWQELAKLIELPSVVVGKREEPIEGAINLQGQTTIREFLAIISMSSAVISCDSSAVHVANALKVPALCIYTSTGPEYGFYPLYGRYLKPSLSCSPCSPNPKRCKTKTYECLRAIEPKLVARELSLLMTDSASPIISMEANKFEAP
ncbi:MAG: glycosyltransferase family 9 protein [Aquificaceae bacterium]|nr:glycosyltransferase family 9 protein [Aquificaceae bacterium]MDW8237378.1 glycosyltransferase family 9 protein [Aquificaceae bacterium]